MGRFKVPRWLVIPIVIILSLVAFAVYEREATRELRAGIVFEEGPPPAIGVPFDAIVLARSGKDVAVFRIYRRVSKYGFFNGCKYKAWYFPGGLEQGVQLTEEPTRGVVYESNIVSADSLLRAGPISVHWSLSNWVYGWGEGPAGGIEVAAIAGSPESISAKEFTALRWIGPN
jgi:hypothetical protein